ncbi:NUDIX domain-containing protein [Candidatus Atribacteria bacterium MT.SAG.1]|nr:NUDIX domain-containing protein [Candidatus Atribacteria bacterium MT.SAG.1]
MAQREKKILATIKEFANKLPKFSDGRIDYSNSNIAPVITVFVEYKGKILLLKRSDEVKVYQGKWNAVAGYLDELKPVHEKALEEIQEELGINENNILWLRIGEPYEFTDAEVSKSWIVHPILVELIKKPNIKMNWEHTKYKWIEPEELKQFDTVFNLDRSLENAFK